MPDRRSNVSRHRPSIRSKSALLRSSLSLGLSPRERRGSETASSTPNSPRESEIKQFRRMSSRVDLSSSSHSPSRRKANVTRYSSMLVRTELSRNSSVQSTTIQRRKSTSPPSLHRRNSSWSSSRRLSHRKGFGFGGMGLLDSSQQRKNIKVVARFRPLSKSERKQGEYEEALEIIGGKQVLIMNKKLGRGSLNSFGFDYAVGSDASQEEVYEKCGKDMVDEFFNGFNCTILAYGQTGSGKTFTMMGDLENPQLRGIIPRLVESVFDHIGQKVDGDDSVSVELQVSYVELYMEHVKDLMVPSNTNLRIREDTSVGIWIEGVSEEKVKSTSEVMDLMKRGSRNRAIASTDMNADSSRSHSVFSIKLTQKRKGEGKVMTSKLTLVDLAGSEKISKTHAEGQTLKEAQQINKSLSALGNVIFALTSNSKHIPYRDSKLTRILSDSIGGNAKTCLIVTGSPAASNKEETLSTLRFGARAKMIKNQAVVNQKSSPVDYAQMLAKSQKEIEILKERLALREQQAKTSDSSDPENPLSKPLTLVSSSKNIRVMRAQVKFTRKTITVAGEKRIEVQQQKSVEKEEFQKSKGAISDLANQMLEAREDEMKKMKLKHAKILEDTMEKAKREAEDNALTIAKLAEALESAQKTRQKEILRVENEFSKRVEDAKSLAMEESKGNKDEKKYLQEKILYLQIQLVNSVKERRKLQEHYEKIQEESVKVLEVFKKKEIETTQRLRDYQNKQKDLTEMLEDCKEREEKSWKFIEDSQVKEAECRRLLEELEKREKESQNLLKESKDREESSQKLLQESKKKDEDSQKLLQLSGEREKELGKMIETKEAEIEKCIEETRQTKRDSHNLLLDSERKQEELENIIKELKSRLTNTESELLKSKHADGKGKEEIAYLKNLLEESQKEMTTRLNDRDEKLKALKEQLDSTANALKSEIEKFNNELDAKAKANERQQAMQQEIRDFNLKLEDLRATAKMAEKEKLEFEQEIEEKEGIIEALRVSAKEDTDAKQTMEAEIKQYKGQLEYSKNNLEISKAASDKEKAKLNATIQSLRVDIDKMTVKYEKETKILRENNSQILADITTKYNKHVEDLKVSAAAAAEAASAREKETSERHQREVKSLRDENLQTIARINTDHNKKLAEDSAQHSSEIIDLKTTHQEAVEALKDDMKRAIGESKRQVDEIKATANAAAEATAETLIGRNKEIESLKEENAKRIAEIKSLHAKRLAEKSTAQAVELEDIKSKHQQALEALREHKDKAIEHLADMKEAADAALVAMTETLKNLTSKHDKDIAALKGKNAGMVAEMKSHHDRQLAEKSVAHAAEVEDMKSAHQNALELLQAEKEKAIEQSDQYSADVKAEADAAAKLAAKNLKDLADEHDKHIQALKDENAKRIAKIKSLSDKQLMDKSAAYSFNMEDVKTRHQQALKALQEENERTIEHSKRHLNDVKETAEAAAETAAKNLKDTTDKLEKEIAALKDEKAKTLAEMKCLHERKLADKSAAQAAEIVDMQTAHQKILEELREDKDRAIEQSERQQAYIKAAAKATAEAAAKSLKNLAEKRDKDIEALKDENAKKIAEMKSLHDKQLGEKSAKHAEEIKYVKREHQQAFQTVQEDNRRVIEQFEKHLGDVKAAADAAAGVAAKNLKDLTDKHSKEVEALKNERSKWISEMKSHHENQLVEKSAAHAREVESIIRRHKENLEKLREDKHKAIKQSERHLEDVKAASVAAAEAAAKKLKDSTDQHDKEIEALKEKYDESIAQMKSLYDARQAEKSAAHATEAEDMKTMHQEALSALREDNERAIAQSNRHLGDVKAAAAAAAGAAAQNLKEITEQHERDMEAQKNENEERMARLESLHEKNLMKLSATHVTEIENIKTRHQESLEAVREEKDRLMEQLDKQLVDVKSAAISAAEIAAKNLEDLSDEHSKQIQALRAEHNDRIAHLKSQHDAQLKESSATHAAEREVIESKHRQTLDAMREEKKREIDKKSIEIQEVRVFLEQRIAALQAGGDEKEVMMLKKIDDMKAKLDISKAANETALSQKSAAEAKAKADLETAAKTADEERKALVAKHDEKLKNARQTAAAAQAAMADQHEKEIQALQEEKSREISEKIVEMQAQSDKHNRELKEAARLHVEMAEEHKIDFQAQIDAHDQELKEIRQAAAKALAQHEKEKEAQALEQENSKRATMLAQREKHDRELSDFRQAAAQVQADMREQLVKDLEALRDEKSREISEKKDIQEKLVEENRLAAEKIADLKRKISALQERSDEKDRLMKQEIDKLQAKLEIAKAAIKTSTTEKESVQGKAKADREAARESIRQLQESLQEEKRQSSQQIANLEEKITTLQAKARRAKEEGMAKTASPEKAAPEAIPTEMSVHAAERNAHTAEIKAMVEKHLKHVSEVQRCRDEEKRLAAKRIANLERQISALQEGGDEKDSLIKQEINELQDKLEVAKAAIETNANEKEAVQSKAKTDQEATRLYILQLQESLQEEKRQSREQITTLEEKIKTLQISLQIARAEKVAPEAIETERSAQAAKMKTLVEKHLEQVSEVQRFRVEEKRLAAKEIANLKRQISAFQEGGNEKASLMKQEIDELRAKLEIAKVATDTKTAEKEAVQGTAKADREATREYILQLHESLQETYEVYTLYLRSSIQHEKRHSSQQIAYLKERIATLQMSLEAALEKVRKEREEGMPREGSDEKERLMKQQIEELQAKLEIAKAAKGTNTAKKETAQDKAKADRVVTREYILQLQESLQETYKVYTLYLRSSMDQEKLQSSEQIAYLEEKITTLQTLLEAKSDLEVGEKAESKLIASSEKAAPESIETERSAHAEEMKAMAEKHRQHVSEVQRCRDEEKRLAAERFANLERQISALQEGGDEKQKLMKQEIDELQDKLEIAKAARETNTNEKEAVQGKVVTSEYVLQLQESLQETYKVYTSYLHSSMQHEKRQSREHITHLEERIEILQISFEAALEENRKMRGGVSKEEGDKKERSMKQEIDELQAKLEIAKAAKDKNKAIEGAIQGKAIADRVVTKEYILHLQESLQETYKVYTLYLRSSLQQEKRQSSEQMTHLEEKIAHLQNLLEAKSNLEVTENAEAKVIASAEKAAPESFETERSIHEAEMKAMVEKHLKDLSEVQRCRHEEKRLAAREIAILERQISALEEGGDEKDRLMKQEIDELQDKLKIAKASTETNAADKEIVQDKATPDREATRVSILQLQENLQETYKVYTLFLRSSMQRERRQSSEQIAILEEKISILQISLEEKRLATERIASLERQISAFQEGGDEKDKLMKQEIDELQAKLEMAEAATETKIAEKEAVLCKAKADQEAARESINQLQLSLQETYKVYTLFLRSSMQQEKHQSSEQNANLEEKIGILQISLEAALEKASKAREEGMLKAKLGLGAAEKAEIGERRAVEITTAKEAKAVEMEALMHEIATFNSTLGDLRTNSKVAADEKERMKKQLEDYESKLKDLKYELERTKLTTEKSAYSALNEENKNADKIKALEKELKEAKETERTMRAKYDEDIRKTKAQLLEERQKLKVKIKEINEEHEGKLQSTVDSYSGIMSKLRESMQNSRAEGETTVNQRIAEKEEEMEVLHSTVEELSDLIARLQGDLSVAERRYLEAEEESDHYRVEIEKKEAEIEKLSLEQLATVNMLEDRLDRSELEREELLKERSDELRDMRRKLSLLKNDLKAASESENRLLSELQRSPTMRLPKSRGFWRTSKAQSAYVQSQLNRLLEHGGTKDLPIATMTNDKTGKRRLRLYKVKNNYRLHVRKTASVANEWNSVGKILGPGTMFRISEEKAGENGQRFLRLADGSGWVFIRHPTSGRTLVMYLGDYASTPIKDIIVDKKSPKSNQIVCNPVAPPGSPASYR